MTMVGKSHVGDTPLSCPWFFMWRGNSVGYLLLVGLFFVCVFFIKQVTFVFVQGLVCWFVGQWAGQDGRQGKDWARQGKAKKGRGKVEGSREEGREGEDHWACWVHDAISLFEHVFFFLKIKTRRSSNPNMHSVRPFFCCPMQQPVSG